MALVHDDEVEKVAGVFFVEAGTVFVFGDGLVDGEIHLAALHNFAIFNLVAGISEGNERLVLWVIHEDVPVSKEEYLRPLYRVVASVPTGLPKLVADLEGDHGFSRARCHSDKNPILPAHNCLNRSIDGNL